MKKILILSMLVSLVIPIFADNKNEIAPTEEKSHYELAVEYFKNTNYQAASNEYELAISEDKLSKPDISCNLGYCYYRLNRLDDAEKILTDARNALTDKKDNAYHCASSYLGFVYSAQGRHDEAIAIHKELVELFPNNWHTWYSMGKTFVLAGKYNEAKRPLDISYSKYENFAHTPYYQGLAYYHLNDFKKSVIFFKRATEKDNSFADAYYYRGLSFFKLALYSEAAGELEKAIKLEPKNKDYKKALKQCRKELKQNEKKKEKNKK